MRLQINCDECDATKINEDNYKDYEEITKFIKDMKQSSSYPPRAK